MILSASVEVKWDWRVVPTVPRCNGAVSESYLLERTLREAESLLRRI